MLFELAKSYGELPLSFDELCGLKNPSVFLFKADSNAFSPRIKKGDILVVDRSARPKCGQLIVFHYEGEQLMRLYYLTGKGIELKSIHSSYPTILIGEDESLEIFGVVRFFLVQTS